MSHRHKKKRSEFPSGEGISIVARIERAFYWVASEWGPWGIVFILMAIIIFILGWKLSQSMDKNSDATVAQTIVNQKLANQLDAMTHRIEENSTINQQTKQNLYEGVEMEKDMFDRVKKIEQNLKDFNRERGK